MRRILLALVAMMAAVSVSAQETVDFRFGCISYGEVLRSMPEYAKAEADLEALKAKFDAETKASEEEFNAKYEVFLSEQRNYAPAILRKRQSELEDMMHRNERFRLESLRLFEQARTDMMKPVRERLDAAIKSVAADCSLAFVLNTDSDAVPFLNKDMAYNITAAVKEAVK